MAGNIKSGANIFGVAGSYAGATSKLPDTGQAADYTATFGEDHDYTSANSAVCDRAASGEDASFTDNADGTISDNCTNLEWKKCSEPDTSITTCGGTHAFYGWGQALVQCEGLNYGGHTDWRLPNRNELLSIVNLSAFNPPVNTTYFPNTGLDSYWSSSTYVYATGNAWPVEISGSTGNDAKNTGYYVRCVRGQ